MATATGHRMETSSGMGPRKTMIIMVTVVGCVAILWPKVFYPMMVGNGQNKNVIKDHRGAGCCGVVLDQETFANASINFASQQAHQQQSPQHPDQQQNLFRKRNFVPFVEIDSIRQERPPHLRPEAMHPAMRERGRAIPQAGSVHGGERPQTPPRIVEGRPGPIPGMRPPMGAGSHQATKSANSMGFIMPLYTIGIVSFFIYTIMKLIFKKSPATPYVEVKPDPAFRSEVFTTDQYIKRPDDGTTKLEPTAANGDPVAVAQQHHQPHPSVQAELTIDYEQLSKQKEATQSAENSELVAVTSAKDELPLDAENPSEGAREEEYSGAAERPAHDPTTEKVVDGIVVQKVVSFEESSFSVRPSIPAVEPAVAEDEVTEVPEVTEVERTLVGEGDAVPEEMVVEEVILKQYASMQRAAVPSVSDELVAQIAEAIADVPVETVDEEVIEKQVSNEQVEASIGMIPVETVETEQVIEEQLSSKLEGQDEEFVTDVLVETIDEENIQTQASNEPLDEVEESVIENPQETVVEEVIQLEQTSLQSSAVSPVSDELVERIEESIADVLAEEDSEEVTQTSNEVVEQIEEPTAEIPTASETVFEEQVSNEQVDNAEELIAEIPVETVVEEIYPEQISNELVGQLEEPIAVGPVETVVEEVIHEQQLSGPTSSEPADKVEESVGEVPKEIVVEEVIQEQQSASLTSAVPPVETEEVAYVEEPIAEIQTQTIVEEVIVEQQSSVHSAEVAPVLKEVEEQVSPVDNDVAKAPILEHTQELDHGEPKHDVQTETTVEQAVEDTKVNQQEEPQQVVETVKLVEVTEVKASNVLDDEPAVVVQKDEQQMNETSETIEAVKPIPQTEAVTETYSTEENTVAPASNEESESKSFSPEAEQSGPTDASTAVQETEPETQLSASEAISKENENDTRDASEKVQGYDTVDSGTVLQSAESEPEQSTVLKELDAETSALVRETVEDITITAELLVQEVLEQAEEFARQQEEEPVHEPALPAYDPATQKLVDGVVIERFARAEIAEPLEAVAEEKQDEEVLLEKISSELREEDVEPAGGAQVVATSEDDGAELDSVSEDTSLSVASVIENQQQSVPVQEVLESATFTTEVMTSSTSSEPVFLEVTDQRPTVDTETVEECEEAPGNLLGAAAPSHTAADRVSIEEVHDDEGGAIVDQAEGKVIEEHVVPISFERGGGSSAGTMTITEVTGDEAIVESPRVSKTTSHLSSPLASAVPVMGAIDEVQESVELQGLGRHVAALSPETLEHVTKEALVERTLNEAAAVVNEIESIVDHIITEKLIQSGASDAPDSPPRLAASAALVVEAIESKASGVQSMIASSSTLDTLDTHPEPTAAAPPLSTAVTNGLTTNLVPESFGDTNTLPASATLGPAPSPASSSPESSDAFPAIPSAHDPSAISSPTSATSSAVTSASVSASETSRINLAVDSPAPSSAAEARNGTASAGDRTDGSSLHSDRVTSARTIIGQVPTSNVSSVTNPKFLTLNLANYSTSDSSGNNSKSSSSAVAYLAQAQPGSGSIVLAGGDGTGQLMELELLRKKLDETERAMTKIIANMGSIPKGQESNVTADAEAETAANGTATESTSTTTTTTDEQSKATNGHAIKPMADGAGSGEQAGKRSSGETSSAGSTPEKKAKKRDTSTERGTVKVMAMEVTAQRENGKRLSRPTTPLLPMGQHQEGANAPTEEKETRSIVLDGRLPHDSKILVSESETAVEKLEPEDSEEEDDAPVILSGKMTLSLINMDFIEKDATGTVAVGEIVTELHKPQEEVTTAPTAKGSD